MSPQQHGADGPPLTDEYFSELDRQVQRTRPQDAPDLRSEARRDVDQLHEMIEERTIKLFGRSQSLDSVAQPSDRAAVLLRQAQAAEARFIAAASTPGTPPEQVQEWKTKCADAYSAWIDELRAVLPSAKAYQARQRKDDDLRTGSPTSRGDFLRSGGRR